MIDTEFETTVQDKVVRFDETKSITTVLAELDILYKKDRIPFLKEIENEDDKKKVFFQI